MLTFEYPVNQRVSGSSPEGGARKEASDSMSYWFFYAFLIFDEIAQNDAFWGGFVSKLCK
jgi:hypothetical protein